MKNVFSDLTTNELAKIYGGKSKLEKDLERRAASFSLSSAWVAFTMTSKYSGSHSHSAKLHC